MRYRSWLVVPGDSERKLGKALSTGADVVVVDLDTSVEHDAKTAARQMAAEWLKAHRRQVLEQAPMARWVRINPIETRQWREDLAAVIGGAPEGIILPRSAGPETIRELAAELYELEQSNQVQPGSTKIIPLAGESPRAALTIPAYADAAQPRLAGLAWSAERLGPAINATRNRELRSGWSEPFRFVRAQTLLAAHACGVMALEAMHDDVEDLKGLKLAAKAARADGFTGMFASNPVQIADINAAFTPSETELEEARRIVAAFENGAEFEGTPIDRRRIDTPQLKQAKQILGATDPRGGDLTPPRVLRPA